MTSRRSDDKEALRQVLAALWGKGSIQRDPVARSIVVLGVVVLLLGVKSTPLVAGGALALIAAACRSGASVDVLRLSALAGSLALLLNAWTEPGRPLLSIGPLEMTAEGIRTGIDRGLRLGGFVGLGRLASRWIDVGMLADSITQLGGRWTTTATGAGRLGRAVRMQVERAALAVALALRFVPEVIDEARRLELAMRSRPRPQAAGRWHRWQALAPLFLPLVAGTIRRADELALTLDARGFGTGDRTSRLESPGSSGRWWVVAAVGALVGATLWVTR